MKNIELCTDCDFNGLYVRLVARSITINHHDHQDLHYVTSLARSLARLHQGRARLFAGLRVLFAVLGTSDASFNPNTSC